MGLFLAAQAVFGLLFLAVSSWASANDPGKGATTLATLLKEASQKNQEYMSARFRSQQYDSRVGLAQELDDSLLAYYYLGFPARILREGPSPPAGSQGTAARPVTETVRGKALFERSSFMVKAMAESRADWYRAVSEDLHLQITRRLRSDFFRLYFQDRIIKVTEHTLATLNNLLDISRQRYAVGQLAQKDILEVQTEKSLLQARLLDLRQKRLALAANLNYLAGRDPESSLQPVCAQEVTHAELSESVPASDVMIRAMKQKRPLIRGYRALVETFRIMRLMIPMYYDMALRRDGTLEVDSGTRAVKAELADFENKVSAELVTERGELYRSLETARLYGEALVPQARQILETLRADFTVGRTDLRKPLQALITLDRYRIDYFQALADHQQALANLAAASAMPLFDAGLCQ